MLHSQSYLCGIKTVETPIRYSLTPALNRTYVELRQNITQTFCYCFCSLNRTYVELRQLICLKLSQLPRTLNRTYVELRPHSQITLKYT